MKRKLYDPKSRSNTVDILKGIGILLLLLSHSIPGDSYLKTWIFSFHMPLFFWCSGYLNTMKYVNGEELRKQFGKRLAKKALALLVPYSVFSLLIILYRVLLDLLYSRTFDAAAFAVDLMRIVELRGIESLWFLPCFLLAEVLFMLLYAFCPRWILYVACAVGMVSGMFFNGYVPDGIAGVVFKVIPGFVFTCFGHVYRRIEESHNCNRHWNVKSVCISLLLIVLGSITSLKNGFVAIGTCQFGFVPIFYASAFLTISGFFILSKGMSAMQIVPFFGKNSIVVLCTNNIVIEILRLLDSKLGGNFFLSHGIVGDFLFSFLLMLIEIPIILVGMRYFRCAFGVFSQKQNKE